MSRMYSSFLAQDFRGFRNLKVDGLQRVNLIAGENNVGKTALLEALFLHCGGYNPNLVLTVAGLRGIGSYKIESDIAVEPPWKSLFRELDESRKITLVGAGSSRATRTIRLTVLGGSDKGRVSPNGNPLSESGEAGVGTTTAAVSSHERQRELQWEYESEGNRGEVRLYVEGGAFKSYPAVPVSPAFPAKFLSGRWRPNFKEDAEFFGELELVNKERELIGILRIVEPRLKRLSTIVLAGEPMLHADIGLQRLVPLAYLGDGLLRLTRLVLAILHNKDGVVLVDEIENGLHHGVLKQVWQTLAHTARHVNAQLFATTHSRECVAAAHEAYCELLEFDFSLQRLERDRSGDIQAVGYDKEALDGAILSGFEVR